MKRLGISLGIAFCLAGFCDAVVPVSQRLTSPVVCPSGTTESLVVSWSSSNNGETTTSSAMYCIDADGGGHQPSGAPVFFTLVGYAFGIALLANLGLYVASRRQS